MNELSPCGHRKYRAAAAEAIALAPSRRPNGGLAHVLVVVMQSLPFARFAGVSPNEKIRAFLARGNLTLCRFRLGQPAVVVYKAVFPTCSRGDARLTFQVRAAENFRRICVCARRAILARVTAVDGALIATLHTHRRRCNASRGCGKWSQRTTRSWP